jgi:hypothetical protein
MVRLTNDGLDFEVKVTVGGVPLQEYECNDDERSKKPHRVVRYLECKPNDNFSISVAIDSANAHPPCSHILEDVYIDGVRPHALDTALTIGRDRTHSHEINQIKSRLNGVIMVNKLRFNSLKIGLCSTINSSF